jgi:hypothetical protein
MKALEFEATPTPEHTLPIPAAVAALIPPGRTVRVLLLVGEDEDEEREWKRLTAGQFAKGYAESDAVYDQFLGR